MGNNRSKIKYQENQTNTKGSATSLHNDKTYNCLLGAATNNQGARGKEICHRLALGR